MIRIFALMERGELRWLRETLAALTLRYAWEDCELNGASVSEDWWAQVKAATDASVIVCDVSLDGAVARLKQARKAYPEVLVIPVAEVSIPPTFYVHPDILPFALLWRPLAAAENERVLFRALSQVCAGREDCLTVKNKAETRRIPYGEICYFEARDKKIFIRLAEQELPFYETMAHLEESLPEYFLRCHKGYLVNQRQIERVDWTSRTIYLRQRITVPLSRSYRNQIKEKIGGAF